MPCKSVTRLHKYNHDEEVEGCCEQELCGGEGVDGVVVDGGVDRVARHRHQAVHGSHDSVDPSCNSKNCSKS